MRMAMLLALVGCNPVESCDEAGSDCCQTSDQCQRVYGSVAPLCGPRGLCVECLLDADCPGVRTCEPDAVVGALCLEAP